MTLWSILLFGILAIALSFFAIVKGWIGYMPNLNELQNPIDRYASQVLSDDGVLMGVWAKRDNRVFVDYDKIAPVVFDALIATEDSRFENHSGIDARALGRAVIKRGILGQESAGGGSTITQQLAKQLYSSQAQNTFERLLQKPIEWAIAVELERHYTKQEILTLYLNYFDFLHNAVGIKTAANVYFGKQPSELTLEEAALLIGMCKNPAYFNPVSQPERARERRNVVLGQMVAYGNLNPSTRDSVAAKPLALKFQRIDHKDGLAPYLREHLRVKMMAKKPKLSDYADWQKEKYHEDSLAWETDPLYGWCNKNKKVDGSPYNLYTDGLKVYTSIDSRMQNYAEQALTKHLRENLQPAFNQQKSNSRFPFSDNITTAEIKKIMNRSMRQSERYRSGIAAGLSEEEVLKSFHQKVPMTLFGYDGYRDVEMTPYDSIKYYKSLLRASFVAMDPHTGKVKAYVGGPEYKSFQYDMVTGGRRQIGSTIKPFVYAMAMQNGMTPCDVAPNVQRTYMVAGKAWTPRNGSRARYGQNVTLKWALSQSNNWISAYLTNKYSSEALVNMLADFGISNSTIHSSLSLSLGPCDVSVAEMAAAYTAFANKGIRTQPLLVTRIEDSRGQVIADFQGITHEVLSEESTYKMLEMLQGVVESGTARRLRSQYGITAQMGGKTGTTNRNSDGWFMAVAPRLVCATWVGGENRDIRFVSTSIGQGAASALPIYAYFMQRVYADTHLGYTQDETFLIPEGFAPCAQTPLLDSFWNTDFAEEIDESIQ